MKPPLIEKSANGDADAKLILFNLINSCFPRSQIIDLSQPLTKGNEGCPSLPTHLVEKPFLILEEAAKLGSPYAKLIYAQYAQTRIAQLHKSPTNSSYQEAAEMEKLAEKYGEDAVKAGVLEAFYFMTRAYYTGVFGPRNPTLAYAHLLPILANDTTQETARFSELLKAQITLSQINEAQIIAFGCTLSPQKKTSPFIMY